MQQPLLDLRIFIADLHVACLPLEDSKPTCAQPLVHAELNDNGAICDFTDPADASFVSTSRSDGAGLDSSSPETRCIG